MLSRVARSVLIGLLTVGALALGGVATAAPTYVDLQVLDVTPQVSGRDITFKVTVQNAGTAKSQKFLVEVFPSSAAAPAANLRGFPAAWVTEGLLSGETKELTLGPIQRANGTFQAWAMVDGLSLVPEADETNNVKGPAPYTVAAPAASVPELFVSNLTLQWESPTKIYYIVDIYNGGAATSQKFRTNLRYDAPDRVNPVYSMVNGETGQNFDHVDGLDAGATRTIKFYWDGIPDGQSSAWVYVDVPWDDKGDAVVEEDEDNNLVGPILVAKNLVPDADEPDIAVTDLRATASGSTIDYEVDVTNAGLAPVGAFDVVVVLDSEGVPDLLATVPPESLTQKVPSLAPGEQTTVAISWTGLAPGTYASWALADPFNQVAEGVETNNAKGPVTVTVEEPPPIEGQDLVIASFDAVTEPNSVGFAVTVRNDGSSAAGPFDVALVLDSEEEPPAGAVGDQSKTIDGLDPGATAKAVFVFDGVAEGIYKSWAIADSKDEVAETAEDNNRSGPKAIYVEGPLAACVDGVEIIQPCRCGAEVVKSGWCCSEAPSSAECVVDEVDAGGTGNGGGGDIAVFEPLPEDQTTESSDGGCSASPGAAAPLGLALLLGLMLAARRRSRV